jgi:hypothetical protein
MEKCGGPLELFKSALEKLESKAKSSSMQTARRFTWHFEKGEYEDCLSKIERSKSNLILVLNL